jgi:glycosyltransferase involved in cell wall biosynthesis
VISVVIPAKNEASALPQVIKRIMAVLPDAEIIVVDDGSNDNTPALAQEAGAKVISHPLSLGNGAAVKTGARAATGDIIVFLDADGQHPPEAIPQLLAKLNQGYLMAVGARDRKGQAGAGRAVANGFYNRFASWITEQPILDLTSGFRAVYAQRFREFLYLLPNGFSYPTTITMAFFRSAYPVAYVSVPVAQRQDTNSHIKPMRDGMRFLLIIFKIATLYAPLKLFFPTAFAFLALGCIHYAYTYFTSDRFTNMSVLLFSAGVIVFLIGLISEQITALMYQRNQS